MGGTQICKKCGSSEIQYQTVVEDKKMGVLRFLWYAFLFCSVIGWLVLIPMLLGKKTKTVTYAVCQGCGNRWKV